MQIIGILPQNFRRGLCGAQSCRSRRCCSPETNLKAHKVKEKWGKLTDDDLTAINGRRDQLEGKIQERYGLAKD